MDARQLIDEVLDRVRLANERRRDDPSAFLGHLRTASECMLLVVGQVPDRRKETLETLRGQLRERLPHEIDRAIQYIQWGANPAQHAGAKLTEVDRSAAVGGFLKLADWFLHTHCPAGDRAALAARLDPLREPTQSPLSRPRRQFSLAAGAGFLLVLGAGLLFWTTRPRCRAVARWSFHLRPAEVILSVGSEHPARTVVEVLEAGRLERRQSRIFRIRLGANGQEGWSFLDPSELEGSCPASWRAPVATSSTTTVTGADGGSRAAR